MGEGDESGLVKRAKGKIGALCIAVSEGVAEGRGHILNKEHGHKRYGESLRQFGVKRTC